MGGFTCHVVCIRAIKDASVGLANIWVPTPAVSTPGVVHAAACMRTCGIPICVRHVSKGREETTLLSRRPPEPVVVIRE